MIDTAMARLGGEVLRRPVVDLEQEIAAAQEAQRKAKREARKELQQARLEKHTEDAHAKVEALKSKLQRPKPGGPRIVPAAGGERNPPRETLSPADGTSLVLRQR